MNVILTDEQLHEAMAFWRPYLGLSDWEINVSFGHWAEMEALADSTPREWCSELEIRISKPETRQPSRGTFGIDMERELVHEMLHGTWSAAESAADMDEGPHNDVAFERSIDLMARSLVRLRRAGVHKFSWENT